MFNMFVLVVALASLSHAAIFYLLIQNGNVYMAAELPCKQIAKSEEDLTILSCDLFQNHDIMYCV